MLPRRLIPLLLLTAALAACGSDEEGAGSGSAATPEATAEATAPPSDNRDTSVKPTIARPSGEPPTRLDKEDIVRGEGQAAKAGDQVTVQYVGVSFSTGEQFAASWDGGQPLPFSLGSGAVIPGWDEGVPGMRVGGRRQLTIPPDQAYGPRGRPPTIAPNETLVFVVDVIDIQPG